ncbi:hypothetical protein [Dongshaea marina]|uniref:hypothetical protein n=1 Tax=Dongshaea marina TaxID=2047966 RepID=UPI00131EE882|nr:hypothetical protein [Dongshaea marina]
MNDPLFSAHGLSHYQQQGRAIIHCPSGSFNKEGIIEQHRVLLGILEKQNLRDWCFIEAPSADGLMTEAAIFELGQSYMELARHGCLGVILVQTHPLQKMYLSKACGYSALPWLLTTDTLEKALEFVKSLSLP